MERRLIHEREILEASTKFLRAKVALQSAFTPETTIPAEGLAQGVNSEGADTEQTSLPEDSAASTDTAVQGQNPEEPQAADQSPDAPKSGQDNADSS